VIRAVEEASDLTESVRSELSQLMQTRDHDDRRSSTSVDTSLASCDGSESVAASCGSVADEQDGKC
jgi:predicted component of type VI protein secretion system